MKKKKTRPKLRDGSELLLYNLTELHETVDAILCLDCGWVGISYSRHDFKTCNCPNRAMIDGGRAYLRAGAKDLKRIQILTIKPGMKLGEQDDREKE